MAFVLEMKKADGILDSFFGWMGRRKIRTEEALLLRSKQIHTFFMGTEITAFHLDKNMVVLRKQRLKPWRIGAYCAKGYYILECHSSVYEKVDVGAKIGKDVEVRSVLKSKAS